MAPDLFDMQTPVASSTPDLFPDVVQPQTPQQTAPAQDPRAAIGMGVVKGVGDTVHGVGQLIQGAGNFVSDGLGDKIVPPVGQQALSSMSEAHGVGEHVGKGLEMIGEFMLGDEALKGLSLVDKIKNLGAVAKIMTEHPTIAKMVSSGVLNATTAGGVGLVKTGSPKEAAKAAAAGGVVGAGLPLAGKAAGEIWNTVSGKAIQENLQGGLRSVLGDAATSAEVQPASSAVRDSAKNVADAVQKKSKGLFQVIDDATDGELTNVQNKIRNVDIKLRGVAGTDDALEEKLLSQKSALEDSLDAVMEKAKQNGVDPSVADDARSSWKQASALNDLDNAIKRSTFGDAKHTSETVDPKKLVNRLQQLKDSGRLQEAVGEDGADDLLDHAYKAVRRSGRRATAGKAAKLAAPVALGAVGYEGAKIVGALHGDGK